MRTGSLVILIVLVSFSVSSLGTHAASGGAPSRLWQFSPQSPGIKAMQVIEDISDDGHQDIFVATSAVARYSSGTVEEFPAELSFIDGKTGTVVRSLNLGKTSIGRARYLDGTIVIWGSGIGLKTYSATLDEVWNQSFTTYPSFFSSCNSSRLLIGVGRNVMAIDVTNGNRLWTYSAPTSLIDVLPVADQIVCYYAENIALLSDDGDLMTTLFVARPPSEGFGYTETLHPFNASSFFFLQDVFFGSSGPTIRKVEINEGNLRVEWKIEVGGGGANKPLVAIDVDGDQVSDFLCVRKEDGTIGVFSGRTGDPLYSTRLAALYIKSACVINDIDGDGMLEVAFAPCTPNYVHGLYLVSLKEVNATLVQVAALDFYNGLISMEDADGDSLSEIVGVTSAGKINCYQGFDLRFIPELSRTIFLGILCLTTSAAVLARRSFAKDKEPMRARKGCGTICVALSCARRPVSPSARGDTPRARTRSEYELHYGFGTVSCAQYPSVRFTERE
jgi:hypothetical protein